MVVKSPNECSRVNRPAMMAIEPKVSHHVTSP